MRDTIVRQLHVGLPLLLLVVAGCTSSVELGPDSGPAPVDSGTPPTDSGTPPTDSGTPPTDSGAPPTDSGTPPDAAMPSCDGTVCGENASCAVMSDMPVCSCDGGFQDNDMDGDCAPDCASTTCGANTSCSDASGTATCSCDAGFQDNDMDGDCAPDCASTTCGANTSCSDASGTATCSCDDGFQDNDMDGDCSPDCASTTCGANTSCSDASGTATCSCNDGFGDDDMDGNCWPPCAVLYGGTASAGPGTPGDNPANAFDGNTSTQFNGITSSVTYLQYDYGPGESRVVPAYTAYMYGWSNTVSFTFRLEGSADGSAWTVLDSRTMTLPISSGPYRFAFGNTTAYRFYRLNFTDTAGGFVRVQELQLSNCAP